MNHYVFKVRHYRQETSLLNSFFNFEMLYVSRFLSDESKENINNLPSSVCDCTFQLQYAFLKAFSHNEFFSCSETEISTSVVLTYKLPTFSPVTVLKVFAEGGLFIYQSQPDLQNISFLKRCQKIELFRLLIHGVINRDVLHPICKTL